MKFYPYLKHQIISAQLFSLALISLPVCSNANEQQPQHISNTELRHQISQQNTAIEKLKQQLNKISQKTEQLEEKQSLNLSGFFDVTAHTTNNSEHPFDLGSFELDMQFDPASYISVSSALVWDGDTAAVAVALLDYHSFDHNVPARGYIFSEPGYHLQFGRFDIPFGIDYEFFAAPDRPNITAPLTTNRIQNGGLNGDGIRVYGNWLKLDYAVYLTNSLFESTGSSLGTRIGIHPGKDPYRVHQHASVSDFSIGLSYLQDRDGEENIRNTLTAIDARWHFSMMEISLESICLDNPVQIVLPNNSLAGKASECGNNLTLLLDYKPVSIFVGYGKWTPDYTAVLDATDNNNSYAVSKLKRFTLGARYVFDDYLKIKLEYYTHMNTETEEPDFEKRRLTFQMVASF